MTQRPSVSAVRAILKEEQATKRRRRAAQSADTAAVEAEFLRQLRELQATFASLR